MGKILEEPRWMEVDNVGKVFTSFNTSRHTNYFRLSFTLTSPIIPELLQKALGNIISRFPYYQVSRRPGAFWYHFVESDRLPLIYEDTTYPCMPFGHKYKPPHPFRVRYFRNRLSVEFHHVLTDATGALVFLRSLTREYLKLNGVDVDAWKQDPIPTQSVPMEEWEDSFWANFTGKLPPPPPEKTSAFRVPYPLGPPGEYYVSHGTVPLDLVKQKATERNSSINDFLLSVLAYSFQTIFESLPEKSKNKHNGPIRIHVPVNLRKMFPSKTMRNFFLALPLELDPRLGHYEFEEMIRKTHHFLRYEIDKRLILQQISRNIRSELHPMVRIVPLFMKNLILGQIFQAGMKGTTSSLSNLGTTGIPESHQSHILGAHFIPPPNPITKTSTSVISHGNALTITFGRLTPWSYVDFTFFHFLRNMGIPVQITSNQKLEEY